MTSPSSLGLFRLFRDQSADMLRQAALLAEEKQVSAGDHLFFEGEVARTLFIVLEGSIMLTMNMPQETEDMEVMGAGDVIGWSSIVEPHIYKLGAHARHDSRLLAFDGQRLRKLFEDNPASGYYFMRHTAEVIGDRLISKCVQIMSLAK